MQFKSVLQVHRSSQELPMLKTKASQNNVLFLNKYSAGHKSLKFSGPSWNSQSLTGERASFETATTTKLLTLNENSLDMEIYSGANLSQFVTAQPHAHMKKYFD